MIKSKSTRLDRKLDLLFWFVISMLPILLYVVNVFNGVTTDFFTFVADNFSFDFIRTTFDDIFTNYFNSSTSISGLLSYMVSVELFHILFDVVVFLPRFARKCIGRVTEI